jgi:hypothetical protein
MKPRTACSAAQQGSVLALNLHHACQVGNAMMRIKACPPHSFLHLQVAAADV